jgi:hypothetical protein
VAHSTPWVPGRAARGEEGWEQSSAEPSKETRTMPSRKWFAAQVSAIGALVVALIHNGWDLSSDLQVVLVGIVVQAIVTYLVPNTPASDAPAGVGTPAPQRA